MAVGDANDVYNRLVMNLPPWFGDATQTNFPVLYGTLQGSVSVFSTLYAQYTNLIGQMRLQTATGNNLDLIAQDYLGNSLPRNQGESDYTYGKRIQAIILEPASTRFAMDNALYIVTGYHPVIFEQFAGDLPAPSGTYINSANTAQSTTYNPVTTYNYQAFIDVYLPQYTGMANYPWYNVAAGAPNFLYYNQTGNGVSVYGGWYGGMSTVKQTVAISDIYKTIQKIKVWGTLIWVQIHYGAPP